MCVYDTIKPFLAIHAPYAQELPWRMVSDPRLPGKGLCKEIIFVPRQKHPEFVEIMQCVGPDYCSEMIVSHNIDISLQFDWYWHVLNGAPQEVLFDRVEVRPFTHVCNGKPSRFDSLAEKLQTRYNREWNGTRIPLNHFVCDLVTSMDKKYTKWLDRQRVR
jgi:hypothetical protein